MTSKKFWQTASNWGFLGGAALFAMNLVGWGFKLEMNHAWLYELLMFIVICPLILYTGKRNAAQSGAEGYSYGRAVGFVFAMMMFAGIVYGVGRFLLINFIAPEYYASLNENAIDSMLLIYSNLPQYDMMLEMKDSMVGWLRNPFYLILQGIMSLVIKGGFLGLVLCAFIYKRPDIFAADGTENKQDDESGSE